MKKHDFFHSKVLNTPLTLYLTGFFMEVDFTGEGKIKSCLKSKPSQNLTLKFGTHILCKMKFQIIKTNYIKCPLFCDNVIKKFGFFCEIL